MLHGAAKVTVNTNNSLTKHKKTKSTKALQSAHLNLNELTPEKNRLKNEKHIAKLIQSYQAIPQNDKENRSDLFSSSMNCRKSKPVDVSRSSIRDLDKPRNSQQITDSFNETIAQEFQPSTHRFLHNTSNTHTSVAGRNSFVTNPTMRNSLMFERQNQLLNFESRKNSQDIVASVP